MDQDRIEFLVKGNPYIESSDYLESIVALLRPPKWYEFTRRRSFDQRVRIIMAEYAKELIRGIQTKTPTHTPTMASKNAETGQETQ